MNEDNEWSKQDFRMWAWDKVCEEKSLGLNERMHVAELLMNFLETGSFSSSGRVVH